MQKAKALAFQASGFSPLQDFPNISLVGGLPPGVERNAKWGPMTFTVNVTPCPEVTLDGVVDSDTSRTFHKPFALRRHSVIGLWNDIP